MRRWTYHRVFGFLIGLLTAFVGVNLLFTCFGAALYFGTVGSKELVFGTLCIIGTLLLIWFSVWCCHKTSKVWMRIMLAVAMLLLLGVYLIFTLVTYFYAGSPGDNKIYYSPDGTHTVIIHHEYFFFESWGKVYEKTTLFTYKEVGEYRLDDYYPSDRFSIKWHDDFFEVDFGPNTYSYEYLDSE